MKLMNSAYEALSCVQSDFNVFVHGGDATPGCLIDGLLDHAERLKNVSLYHLHTHGPAKYADVKFRDSFNVRNFFVGSNLRKHLDYDRVDYLPCFLSEIPHLFRAKICPIKVALVQVSPPDIHGYCSLGTSVDIAKAAVDAAEIVVAQINENMPRVHGDGFIHVDDIDFAVEHNSPINYSVRPELTEADLEIGQLVASLIEDGSTLQMGIGAVPDAVLHNLKNHKHLGIHSEMWTFGAMDLIKSGAVDNSRKKHHVGESLSSFIIGDKEVHDFINDNPSIVQKGSDFVNNPFEIKENPKVCAVNSAVEIDLTGQVCADSVGPNIISGVGGQMDFMRGAFLSEGGKPIIALNSRSKKGLPKIVAQLRPGAGVVTTRSHVHYVVTEYGIAQLYGKTLKERSRALIKIAHPGDREHLERASWHL